MACLRPNVSAENTLGWGSTSTIRIAHQSRVTSERVGQRIRRIKPSPSTEAADRANQLRREGRAIVSLVVRELDFDTPRHIRQAASRAMEEGATHYTSLAGTVKLRQAIAANLLRENDLHYEPGEIIVTNGVKSAIYSALAATLEPGSQVVIPAPYWVSYPDMVLACDGVPVPVACPEAHGFKLQPAQLEAAITDRTRWLILNSPSNPTGATYTDAEYRALVDVLVMTDDIYEHIRFEGGTAPHLLAAAPELRDRMLAVNGVSKTYAMTGWRIGWVAGPRDLVRGLDTFLSQAAGNSCSVSQAAATAALNGSQEFVAESVATYLARRDRMAAGINAIRGLSPVCRAGCRKGRSTCSSTAAACWAGDAIRQTLGDRWRRSAPPAGQRGRRGGGRCVLRPVALFPAVHCHGHQNVGRGHRPHRACRVRAELNASLHQGHTVAAIETHPPAPQADPEVIAALRGIAVSLVSDQLRRNRGSKGLIPYHSPAPLAGTAVTVKTRGDDNLAILRAYDLCRPGDVMVVDADGDLENALVGGIMTFAAASLGLAGMVLDGAIRDVAEIRERTFPVDARGVRPTAALTRTARAQ